MKKIKKNWFRIFITIVCLTSLLSNATYAENSEIKDIKKEIKHIEVSSERNVGSLIQLNRKLLEYQMQRNLYKDAIQTALLLENLNLELYGKNSVELFNAKKETLNLYVCVNDEALRKSKLEEMEKIALSSDSSTKATYYYELYKYYANYEDMDKVKAILETLYAIPELSSDDKLNITEKIAENSSYLKDIKNTNKFLDEYYKLIVNTYKVPYGRLASYYIRKIYLNNDIQNLYKDFMPLYNEAKNNISQIPVNENPKAQLNHLNYYLANYYLEMGEFDKAKQIIDDFYIADIYQLSMQKSLYERYYEKTKNFTERKKVIDSFKREFKSNKNFSYQNKITIKEKYAKLYKDKEEYEKAEKYFLDIIDLINKYSNGNPARKYVFYINLAELNVDNKICLDDAIMYLNLAKNEYKHKENSYEYAKEQFITAKILLKKSQPEEAIKYLTSAENIQIKVPTNRALADSYEQHAYAFAQLGNYDLAIKYIDKYINIREQEYGKNNVEVYIANKNKIGIMYQFNHNDEADKLSAKIEKDFINGNIQGENYDFIFDMNMNLAYKNFENGMFDDVLKYTDSAIKYASTSQKHKEVNDLISKTYSKMGNKH